MKITLNELKKVIENILKEDAPLNIMDMNSEIKFKYPDLMKMYQELYKVYMYLDSLEDKVANKPELHDRQNRMKKVLMAIRKNLKL